MAIKIDLLPGYVKLRRDLNRSIGACIVAVCVVSAGLAVQLKKRQNELATAKENLAVMTAVADQATAAASATTAAQTESAPAEGAIAFMTASSKTGAERAALVDLVRKYIYEDAIVSSIDISDGKKVTIKATVRTPDEYATFLLNLRRASDLQGGVLFTGTPTAGGPQSFGNGARPFLMPIAPNGEPVPIVYPIDVTAEGTLKNPVVVPVDPTTGAGAPAPGTDPGAPPTGG